MRSEVVEDIGWVEKDFGWGGNSLEGGSVFVFEVAIAVVGRRTHVRFPIGESI